MSVSQRFLEGRDEHPVADPLEEHMIALEPEFAGEPDALTTAIAKQFCCLHRYTPCPVVYMVSI
jgi:hypothetical protein